MRNIFLMLAAVSVMGFYGCKTDKTKTKEVKKERVIAKKTNEQVRSDLDQLMLEMETAWNTMMASDDQKIANLQTLHARIGRDKKYDKETLTKVIATNETLKKQRYDRQGISSVAAVDAYDSLQIQVMDDTNILIENNNLALRDTITAALLNQVQEDDSRVPIYRGYYDKAAKNFNQYLKDYRPQIQQLGPPYSELQPMPLFVETQLQ